MSEAELDPVKVGKAGIALCRKNEWDKAIECLNYAVNAHERAEIPGHYYAYLGWAMARGQKKRREGLELCQRAVELEFLNPENFLLLARIHLLLREKRAAIEALQRGLKVDSQHPEIVELRAKLGVRRIPVLGFLPRSHKLNEILGRIRHRFVKPAPVSK